MRNILALLTTTALAACGGAGVQTAGSVSTAPAPTPTATPGSPTPVPTGHTFVRPTEPKTYSAIGGVHKYEYRTSNDANAPRPGEQYDQLYAGNASTARDSDISVTYNPRDAIFDIVIADELATVSRDSRFQDPAHRTDFGGALEPQDGVPNLTANGVLYLQNGASSNTLVFDRTQSNVFPIGNADSGVVTQTFFYQRPGTVTNHVTFAGYVRNATAIVLVEPNNAPAYLEQRHTLERGAFVFGERTPTSVVPKSGTASFSGPMIATLVYNPLLDNDPRAPTYFQWMSGTANTSIDFGGNAFTIGLTGTVSSPLLDIYTSRVFALQDGATFTASGAGRVDLVQVGGFAGQFQTASFTQPNGTVLPLVIAGSSVDGAFYGPNSEEVGGGFRIVGGTPDERIDILGAFTGKKP